MATTTTIQGVDQLKGDSLGSELHVYQITAYVTGTYLTATKPNFNILTALQARHQGITAVDVKKVVALRDYRVSTTRYTAPNAQIALSNVNTSCVNDKVVFEVDSGETNGDTGTEIADATALDGYFTFLVVTEVTGG